MKTAKKIVNAIALTAELAPGVAAILVGLYLVVATKTGMLLY